MKKNQNDAPVIVEIYELSRVMRRYFDRRARSLGFTSEQWRAMGQLQRNPGITQAGLAEILEIQPISLTRTLDRMAAAGLVERRPDPKDRRALRLYLTPEAEPSLKLLRREYDQFRKRASEGMTATQEAQLLALLGQVRINLDKQDTASTVSPAKTARG